VLVSSLDPPGMLQLFLIHRAPLFLTIRFQPHYTTKLRRSDTLLTYFENTNGKERRNDGNGG
jgi:hypothetical protein